MRMVTLLTGLAMVLLTVTPAAAKPHDKHGGWDGDRGRDGRGEQVSHRDRDDDRHDDDDDDDGWSRRAEDEDRSRDHNRGRRGVFQNRWDGMRDEDADSLSDVLQDCVSTDNLRDLRWGQLWQLVQVIGLTPRERRRIHDLGDLSDALQDHLDENDVQDLKLKQILQVAHACGLSTRDIVDILKQV